MKPCYYYKIMKRKQSECKCQCRYQYDIDHSTFVIHID